MDGLGEPGLGRVGEFLGEAKSAVSGVANWLAGEGEKITWIGKQAADGIRRNVTRESVEAAGNKAMNTAERWASKVVTMPNDDLSKIRLTKSASIAMGGIAMATMIQGGFNRAEEIAMGEMDPYMVGPAPRIPSYEDNAGATGDLVFALHKNKRAY